VARHQGRRRRPPPRAGAGRRRSALVPFLAVMAVGAVIVIVVAVSLDGGGGDRAPSDPGDIAQGEALYLRHCAACHGSDLAGTAQGPPFLDVIYAPNHHADEAFQRAVAFGVVQHHWDFGPMPPIPGLSRDEVASIVAFIRAQQQAAGIFRDPSHP
jgi:mono/diheme cytochrome c family protein